MHQHPPLAQVRVTMIHTTSAAMTKMVGFTLLCDMRSTVHASAQVIQLADIHALMIQDKVRTASYASFIMTNTALFCGAVVLDVGCGTGILSLFAARAGARRVIAVDASDIAKKTRSVVKANKLEDVIT
jgi:predicted RNA methylase